MPGQAWPPSLDLRAVTNRRAHGFLAQSRRPEASGSTSSQARPPAAPGTVDDSRDTLEAFPCGTSRCLRFRTVRAGDPEIAWCPLGDFERNKRPLRKPVEGGGSQLTCATFQEPKAARYLKEAA